MRRSARARGADSTTRILSELFATLRRDGLEVSTAQAITAARAVALVGFQDREQLEAAVEAVLVVRPQDLELFRRSFRDFFRVDRGHAGDLFDRLRGRGFTASEVDVLREIFQGVSHRSGQGGEAEGVSVLAGTPQDLEWLLRGARMRRTLAPMSSPKMAGHFAARAHRVLGLDRAADVVERLGKVLEEALGKERGEAMGAALREELAAIKRRVRLDLEKRATGRPEPAGERRSAVDTPFASLDESEARDVARAVRRLVEKLRGAARVRMRHRARGRIDSRRTTRAAMRTFGVPVRLYFKRPREDRPKLVVLCDVSDSVRNASRFMLEFVAMASDLFTRVRSFVFVSELAETTELFAAKTTDRALRTLASGAIVDLGASSSYERALREAERAIGPTLDRRTTVVILGDGRTNHRPDGAEVVARLKDRCRALLWICPEAPSQWGLGDSRMNRYREVCTTVLSARTARELEEAARRLVRLR